MEMLDLLEKMMKFAGEKVGQKPGDQWRGSDKAPPGTKLVGDSILKDLSKGPTAKSKEQELSEEYQAFLEAEFKDTVDKRPSRKGSRPSRGHEPKSGYKTIKTDEGVPYKATNPHPASKDPVVAKVLKQMRPGLTGLDMNNEAFLYFAYELGKTRAREMWEDYGPAIKYFYQSGIGVNESDDNDPVEARWIVKVEDDEGQHLKTFRDEFPNLEAAKKAYEKHEPYASDFKYTSIKKNTNEAIDSDLVQSMSQDSFNRAGYNPISDERDYLDKLSKLSKLYRQQGLDQTMKAEIFQRINDLNAEARKKGYIQAESRGHKIIATKLKDIERSKKFASGELKIPTPQERQAQLKKLEKEPKQVKEYDSTTITPYGQTAKKLDPKQVQKVSANLNTQKTALSQLKQMNPEIDPQKAATAMTKDVATMSPQEKEILAQVAKTVSPALGTQSFGSLKTAIQKSQVK